MNYKNFGEASLNSYSGIGFGGNTYAKLSNEELIKTKEKISRALKLNNGNRGQYIGEKNPMFGKRCPVRKEYKIRNVVENKEYSLDSRSKLVDFLKEYKNSTYSDKSYLEKENPITKKNMSDFCMGRIKNIDNFILLSIIRECDKV